MNKELQKKREEIDLLDKKLVELLDQRADYAREISQIKQCDNKPQVYVPGREEMILSKIGETHRGVFPKQALQTIFVEIISACRNLESSDKIFFFGENFGWVHDAAFQQFGSSTKLKNLEHPEELLSALSHNVGSMAFVPLCSGYPGVHNLLEMLLSQKYFLLAETQVKPNFALATRSNIEPENLREICGTRETFNLLRHWIASLSIPTKLIFCKTMEEVMESLVESRNIAGLIPQNIAKASDLKILQSGLKSQDEGLIRCVTISSTFNAQHTETMKATVLATLPQKPGALMKVIAPLRKNKINILSIETFRFYEKPWKDLFIIDFEPPASEEILSNIIKQIQKHCLFLKFLGFYPVLG